MQIAVVEVDYVLPMPFAIKGRDWQNWPGTTSSMCILSYCIMKAERTQGSVILSIII